jgi:small-conductance mechanosensitive channel
MNIYSEWQSILWSLLTLAIAAVAGLILHRIVYGAARRVTRRTPGKTDDLLLHYSIRPARLIVPVAAMLLTTPGLPLPEHIVQTIRHGVLLALIGGISWLFISLLGVIEDLLSERYRIDVADNLAGRRVKTQVHVLRRITSVIIVVVGFAVMLMTFPTIWNIGAGLFASAGAAGLVVGMAAKPTLSSLLAGIQIALTEPIRLDDVVVVEGEWGRIEEILTTYVVVRIWDQRRLVLPLSYFIEHPFQNWTRSTSEILGTVFLYVDYTVPVEQLRAELHRILSSSPLWDGRVWNLQVTNAKESTVEVRALMSSSDSGKAWDLRCLVRERMLEFIQTHCPHALPRTRADVSGQVRTEPAQGTP